MLVQATMAALCGTLLLFFNAALCPAENWNQGRGSRRSGHTCQTDCPLA